MKNVELYDYLNLLYPKITYKRPPKQNKINKKTKKHFTSVFTIQINVGGQLTDLELH